MAILALQKLDEDRAEAGFPLRDDLEQLMHGGYACKADGTDGYGGYWDAVETFGSGERHVKLLPRAPHYEVREKPSDDVS